MSLAKIVSTNFQFNVISNPPVILATHIFESFQSKLFVGIPIVIQTTLLHATRAEVSWFMGKSNDNVSDKFLSKFKDLILLKIIKY